MDQPTPTATDETVDRPADEVSPAAAAGDTDNAVAEDVLVEEVSIDGMCGVY